MRTTVVVVTFQSEETVASCVASIPEDAELIVVDNASTDASVERAASAGAVLLANPDNRGFAAAANQGARRATGEFLLFLNPDAALDHGCVDRLISVLEARPEVAIVGPAIIRSPDGDLAGSWPYPTARLTWRHELALHRIGGHDAARDGFVVGTCMLVRRDWFDRLAGFDEAYFLYGEDADFCWRARALGGANAVVAGAAITHIGGHSSNQLQSSFEHFHRGTELFIAKHQGRRALLSHRVAVLIGSLIRAVLLLPFDRVRSRWFRRLALREIALLVSSPVSVAPPATRSAP